MPQGSPTVALTLSDETLAALAECVAGHIALRLQEEADAPVGWLDAKDAALYAGCSVSSLHKAMALRAIEFSQPVRRGKAWFRREWIDSWREG